MTVLFFGKSKLYREMVGLSVKSIIATSYLKNTMSYMRKTTEDYISLDNIDGVEVQLL